MLLSAAVLLLLFGASSLWVLLDRVVVWGEVLQVCGQCEYDLAGLPERTPCPECGGRTLKRTPDRREWVVGSLDRSVLLGSLVVLTVFAIIAEPLTVQIFTLSYRRDGFSELTASHMVRKVDLGGNAPVWSLIVFSPLTLFVVLSPFIANLKPRGKSWKNWSGWLVAAVLTCGACLGIWYR